MFKTKNQNSSVVYFDARCACFSTKAHGGIHMARGYSTSLSQIRCHDVHVVAPYSSPAFSQVEIRICSYRILIYYGAVFLVSIPYYLLHNQMVSILIFMRLILRDRSLDTITRIEQITDGSIVI